MKIFFLNNTMKVIYIYSIVLLLMTAHNVLSQKVQCVTTPQPAWVLSPNIDKNFYFGVNSASFKDNSLDYKTKQLAKERAIKDLSYSLSVKIQSYYSEHLSQFENSFVNSSLMLSVALTLKGIKVIDNWTDYKNCRYWVLVSIEKNIADKQVKEQNFINKVLDFLNSRHEEIKEGINSIIELSNRKNKIIEAQLNHYSQLFHSLEQKISEPNELPIYKNLIRKIDLLLKRFEDFQKQGNQSINININKQESFVHDLALVSNKVNSDYLLTLLEDDITKVSSGFEVKIVPEKGQGAIYFQGESIRFTIEANYDCYVKVLYIQSTGEETMLLPNVYDRNNFIKAGQLKIVGKYNEVKVLEPSGRETITIIASKEKIIMGEQLNSALKKNKSFYTKSVKDPLYAASSRLLGVTGNNNSFATDTCFIITKKRIY